ncbi:hypothetical protein CR983_01885 [Candidatus Saccharibacteria bacterium]|nr:MAG: hypothetical protein CR983_01885 [Candidatus Saccharibacteria bacterium]
MSAQQKNAGKNLIVIGLLLLGLFAGSLYLGDKNTDQDAATDSESQQQDAKKPEDKSSDDKKDKKDEKSEKSEKSEKTKQETAADDAKKPSTTATETKGGYSFTAKRGDSYTVAARHAVAAAKNDLTPAERVAAETKLAQEAGAPALEVGQTVTISKEKVASAIDWAQKLSAAQKNYWQYYADQIVW